MIVCGTGHRPDKIGGYSDEVFKQLSLFLKAYLRQLRPLKVISGMAQGFDQALAVAAISEKIPFIAAIPCPGQQLVWPKEARDKYLEILEHADAQFVVSPKYTPYCMQKRNEWMVDNSDAVIALWNGTDGGTANCVRYAESKKKEIYHAWDEWEYFNERRIN